MSGFTINVGKKTVTIKPTEERKAIDFAVGMLNGEAYVGYWQDVELIDEFGDVIDIDTWPMLIFENKIVPYTKEYLAELGVKRATIPVESDNWWSGKIVDVDPQKYYQEVYERFSYYIDAPERNLHFLSLWTIGTIFHNFFNAYPYLHLYGPKRSGKTKTLTLIKLMGFNAIKSHSLTPATIYRLVESAHATLLLDEQDYLVDPERRTEFRTLLLGGYKKGSFVYRSEKTSKGKIVPTRFGIYSPKALANIEGLEDVLQDRTITVTMMRSIDPKITRREPDEEDPSWLNLRDKLASLYIKYWKEVHSAYISTLRALGDTEDYTGIPEEVRDKFVSARDYIHSRIREIWSPIIALALFFESKGVNNLLDSVFTLAKENYTERQTDEAESPEAGIVYALKKIYDGDRYYALADITNAYKEETGIERIDSRSIGRLMKRLGFKDKRRIVGRVQYFVSGKSINDLAKRFGVVFDEDASIGEITQTIQTTQTPQTLKDQLEKALSWCRTKGSFTIGEMAFSLGIKASEAEKLLKIMLDEKKVVKMGEVYVAT